ncbi:MAG: hypothetical protein JWQ23_2140 [Herminiimonas sp.]|jgi:hypothetical protein|nr:hypothetical protein [Herminiimonas sp.]
MNSIPFEKIPLEAAGGANAANLDVDNAKDQWIVALRKAQNPADYKVRNATLDWLEALPPELRPFTLCTQYPRIANTIAERAHDRIACKEYLEALVFDLRGTRKGFPTDVGRELMRLETHYSS